MAFRKANLKLEVTPQITPEGGIILDVDINKDSRGETTAAGIAINTKHVQTQVLVENGGTVVIGGIFELNEIDDTTKVPLLGDIPYVGNLFKNKSKTANKSELLIFITPRVISDRGVMRSYSPFRRFVLRSKMMKLFKLVAGLSLAALLTACGGGGSPGVTLLGAYDHNANHNNNGHPSVGHARRYRSALLGEHAAFRGRRSDANGGGQECDQRWDG